MIIRNRYKLFILLHLTTASCVEEIAFETENFESALVIDATITNEMKHQEIFISRTYRFEEDGPNPESNVTVTVVGGNEEFIFEETEAGTYISTVAFSAQPNLDYRLEITTGNGSVYTSNIEQLTSTAQIDALYPMRETNDDGVNGMSIYVDSFDPMGNAQYYRYEYVETFKIIAPEYVDMDAIVINAEICEVGLTKRSPELEVCYRTETSQNITQTNTTAFAEDRVSRHLVRFLSSEDYKISHRYSILVKQYIQTREAYEYLETLRKFTNEGSIFSQIQPGFVIGNITSEKNPLEKVIGFFEVSSVSFKRVFFNYIDFYPNELLPPYVISCEFGAPRQFKPDGSCGGLITVINSGFLVYLAPNIGEVPDGGPYLMVRRACGDCTVLGFLD